MSAGACHEKVEWGWNFDSTDKFGMDSHIWSDGMAWRGDAFPWCLDILNDSWHIEHWVLGAFSGICGDTDSQRFVLHESDSSAIIF